MRPTNGLDTFGTDVLDHKELPFTQVLSRYLDAKRSVLLFSKGIILVEGDGEEILIPALIKKVLGVSLDEMGIGLVNVGNVAFENIACIFDETRLQRRCAIVTDLDTTMRFIIRPYAMYSDRLSKGYTIIDILSAVNQCREIDNDGIVCLKETINSVFRLLKTDISKEKNLLILENRFFDRIDDRARRYSLSTDYNSISRYFKEKEGVVVSTIHGVKGEEYTTVIATGLLNGYLPHWDYIIKPEKQPHRKAETLKLLYVLCSRAKQNLYLFSETGYRTRNGSEYTPTNELSLITHMLGA
jgi:hypothetical protein